MKQLTLLLLMLFCHIVDDYYLQGILASMKQRKWWLDNAPEQMYRYDWFVALLEHAFSWAFMIHLPLIIYRYFGLIEYTGFVFLVSFIINWIMSRQMNRLVCTQQDLIFRKSQRRTWKKFVTASG